MNKQKQNPDNEPLVNPEDVLSDFLQDSLPHLASLLRDSVPYWEDQYRWEKAADEYFREHKSRVRVWWPILTPEWLQSLPKYRSCIEALKYDEIIGPQLDSLVGTSNFASCIQSNAILESFICTMLDNEGRVEFSENRFKDKWIEMICFFHAERIPHKTVGLFPRLALPRYPLQLNSQLVLDRMTDSEVTRCNQIGLLRPNSLQFPLINPEVPVGLRRTLSLPKVILTNDDPQEHLQVEDEGTFGYRPNGNEHLVMEDILSAMRLFKHTTIRTAGYATWSDSYFSSGTSFRILQQWPYFGIFQLTENELPQFLDLWRLLEDQLQAQNFSIRRFNLAFERDLLEDRIVDLVIAAESLLLGDHDDKYRGEIRFRFALRAAKFIQHPIYNEHDVFKIMREAYDARSAIVHSGAPPTRIKLPDNPSANLGNLVEIVEEIVRLGLRKTLLMKQDAKQLHQSHCWDTLLF